LTTAVEKLAKEDAAIQASVVEHNAVPVAADEPVADAAELP